MNAAEGAETACGIAPTQYDIVVTLPHIYRNQTNCMRWIALTNLVNNKSILAQAIGASRYSNSIEATKATLDYMGIGAVNSSKFRSITVRTVRRIERLIEYPFYFSIFFTAAVSWRFAAAAETELVVTNLIVDAKQKSDAAAAVTAASSAAAAQQAQVEADAAAASSSSAAGSFYSSFYSCTVSS